MRGMSGQELQDKLNICSVYITQVCTHIEKNGILSIKCIFLRSVRNYHLYIRIPVDYTMDYTKAASSKMCY